MNRRSIEITEYIFFLLSVFGTVAAILTEQIFYVAIPITLSLGWNLVIRRLNQQSIHSEFPKINQIMNNINERLILVDAWKEHLISTIQEQMEVYVQGLKEEQQDYITNLQRQVEDLRQVQQNQNLEFSQIKQQVDFIHQRFQQLETSLQEWKVTIEEKFEHPKTANAEVIDSCKQMINQLETALQEPLNKIKELDNLLQKSQIDIEEIKQKEKERNTYFSDMVNSLEKRFQYVDNFMEKSEITINQINNEIQTVNTNVQVELENIIKNTGEEIGEINQVINKIIEIESLPSQEQLESEKPEISTGTKTVITNHPDNKEKKSELMSVMTLRGHKDKVLAVVFSPDGQVLASGSDDKTINLWNLNTRKIRTLKGHKGSAWSAGINSLAFSPDGQVLASGSDDKTIKLWNLETGEKVHTLKGHQEKVYCIAISPDGKILASGSKDKTIKLWSLATGENLSTLEIHQDEVLSLAFSPDGEILASGGGGNDKTIKLCHLNDKNVKTITGHSDWFGGIKCLAFSPDGKILASGSNDKTIKLWLVVNNQEICTFTGHTDDVYSVAFSPDGQVLASGSKDKTIKLWQVETAREISTFVSSRDDVYSVAFSPDGRMLAAGNGDHTITLFPHF